jgi:hypothetical protein
LGNARLGISGVGEKVMIAKFCEKALMILGKTNDGNDLTAPHLKLVEMAVNGFLNEAGKVAFDELYRQVFTGEYDRPWLHGVEHMTADHSGYIYWKGVNVEHYDFPYESSNAKNVRDLASRCLHIESLGITPTIGTAIWCWGWMKELTADHQWLNFFKHNPGLPGLWEGNDSLVIVIAEDRLVLVNSGKVEFFTGIKSFLDARGVQYDPEDAVYHQFVAAGFGIPKAGQGDNLGIIYAPLDGVIALLERYQVPSDLYLSGLPDTKQSANIN